MSTVDDLIYRMFYFEISTVESTKLRLKNESRLRKSEIALIEALIMPLEIDTENSSHGKRVDEPVRATFSQLFNN